MAGQFVKSFLLPWQSIALILSNKKLFLFSLIPWFINIFIFAGLLIAYGFWGISVAHKLASSLGDTWWALTIAWIVGILMIMGLSALQILLFTYLAMLLSGVFGELLSYHTELHICGSAKASPEGNMLKIFVRSVIEEFKGMLFFSLVFLVLLSLNFIPVAGNILFAVVAPLWTALSLAFEFTAPTSERRGMRFASKKRMIFAHKWSALGFGLGILPMSLIPILNFSFIPFAIVGGTRWMLLNEEMEKL